MPAETPTCFARCSNWGAGGNHSPHTFTPIAACQWSPILGSSPRGAEFDESSSVAIAVHTIAMKTAAQHTSRTMTTVFPGRVIDGRVTASSVGEGAGDHLADRLVLGQEPVVARDRLDHLDPGVPGDPGCELVLQPQGVEPVGRDPADRDLAGDARQRGGDAAAPASDVVMVHRPRQGDVRVRVEAPRELLAVVLEVRLDRVAAAVEGLLVPLVP